MGDNTIQTKITNELQIHIHEPNSKSDRYLNKIVLKKVTQIRGNKYIATNDFSKSSILKNTHYYESRVHQILGAGKVY